MENEMEASIPHVIYYKVLQRNIEEGIDIYIYMYMYALDIKLYHSGNMYF